MTTKKYTQEELWMLDNLMTAHREQFPSGGSEKYVNTSGVHFYFALPFSESAAAIDIEIKWNGQVEIGGIEGISFLPVPHLAELVTQTWENDNVYL